MEIEWKGSSVSFVADAKKLKCIVEFSVDVEGLKDGYSYGREGLANRVIGQVTDKISNLILEKESSRIIESIDIEEIVKRVKLNIVQNVARS